MLDSNEIQQKTLLQILKTINQGLVYEGLCYSCMVPRFQTKA